MNNNDLGKLLIRLCVGGLMLFHGVHKLIHGYGFIAGKLNAAHLPAWLVAGVPMGEVVAPLLIVLGLYTRPAALVEAVLMGMAVWLVHMGQLASLTDQGGYALELQAFYFFGSIAIFFLGAGRYSVTKGTGPWN
ncbi:DoxX family protein [Chlorobaculum thiosulfatiphilum]|uniref:DoxX family protein n=1 Tax=Chlorobaculum thiosulfatiphilum TaxID=115852 RepID=A0A5C4RZW2_CHLTI|nr:DoxX family protein [Chlorobaculum thiosulfatiphilum]TNJ36803.1 DoxX family protein [Chlorobaculum thiosulfatiphilum]